MGNDFKGAEYFYEDQLDDLGIDWKDHTYTNTKKSGVHYSFQGDAKLNMADAFPYMIRNLEESGNKLFCANAHSLLVAESLVEFRKLPSV